MIFNILKTKGFSLIEVLMSLLLISLILFGLDAGQLYTMHEVKILYFFNLAKNQLNNISERLNALKMSDGFNEQLTMWNLENQTELPLGFGTISGVFPNYIATIYWGDISHHCKNNMIGLSGCIIKKIQLA